MTELVPNTPSQVTEATNTQRSVLESAERSYGDSYLHEMLQGADVAHRSPSPARPSAIPATSSPFNALDDIEDPDISRTVESQHFPPAAASAEIPVRDRRSGSHSQPPFEVSGNLGETQVQSLGRDFQLAPYRCRQEGNRMESEQSFSVDDSLLEEGDTTRRGEQDSKIDDGEQSMEFTSAAGGIQVDEEDLNMDQSALDQSDTLERVEQISRTDAETTLGAHSQKENSHAQPSQRRQPTPLPPPPAPLGPRSSHLNVESGTGPSSSPAVAGHLLQHRLSPQKKVQPLDSNGPTPSALTEPASSGDFTGSFLLPHPQAAESDPHGTSRSKSMPELSQDLSGPETSTPAFTGAPLPHPPLTAARTLPEFSRIVNPVLPVPSIPILATERKGTAVYQSSEAMDTVAAKAKKKKRRNEWGDTSQETPDAVEQQQQQLDDDSDADEEEEIDELEDDLSATEVAELEQPIAATQVEDDDGEQSMSMDKTVGGREQSMSLAESRAATPKPTASDEMWLAGRPSSEDAKEETQDSVATSYAPSAPPVQPPSHSADSSSFASSSARLQPRASLETPQFGPDFGGSQSQSVNGDLDESMSSSSRPMNLTEIGGLLSSQAGGSQIEVEPTQIDYDVEQLPLISGDLSVGSTRGLPAFRVESAGSANGTTLSVPRPGRELRRVPPPPSPVHPVVSGAALPETQQSSSPGVPLPPTAIATVVSGSSHQSTPQHTSSPAPVVEPAPNETSLPSSAGVAVPSSQLQLPPQQATASTSSNGVVPDSEGPTQDSPPPASRPPPLRVQLVAAPSVVAEEASVIGSMDVDQLADDQQTVAPRTEETDQSGEPTADEQMEESIEQPLAKLVAAKKLATGNSGSKKAPESKAKTPAPKRLDKGKGRAAPVTPDSPDELDLFQPTQPHRQPTRPAPPAEEEPQLETNYEELPGIDNSKRLSPKKSGHVRSSSTASAAASPGRPRKRKLSNVVPVVEIEVPAKRTKKPVARKAAPKTKVPGRGKSTVTKAGAPKTDIKSRKAASKSVGGRTESPEEASEAGPVAGPSRLRFESVDEIMPDVSVASSERGDVKPGHEGPKISLPATAPFTRCFGLWRDDGWLYPGTITGVAAGQLKIVFDDESRGRLAFSEIRRCELRQGDYLRYRGDEIDTETQAAVLERDVRVYRAERGTDGQDVVGTLHKTDVIVVSPLDMPLDQQAEACRRDHGVQRLCVEGVTVGPEHLAQFDDRKLTAAEIAGFVGRTEKAIKPVALLNVSAAPALEPVAANKKAGLFSRMALLITNTPAKVNDAEKAAFLSLLHEHGAIVVDLGHLFSVRVGAKGGDSVLEFSNSGTFKNIDTILLIAERPCTTSKYLVALALGVPCVSPRFIETSVEENSRLDWRDFALTSGFLQSLNTHAIGAQMRSIGKPSFDLDSLSLLHGKGGIFSGLGILVVAKKAKSQTDYTRNLLSILAAAGATKIHFVNSIEVAGSAVGYDHVILEDSTKKPSSMSTHPGVGNMTWLKQCLIAGRRLSASVMKAVED